MTKESKVGQTKAEAPIIAKVMCHANEMKEHSFAQQFSPKQAKTVIGEIASNAAFEEMRQMHDHRCFEPISSVS